VTGRSWRPYAAPAAALLAATLVVVGVRVGLQDDGGSSNPAPAKPAKAVVHSRSKPAAHPAAKQVYVVRAGDTLGTIAASTGVSVARLEQLNPTLEPTSLFIGDQIRLR
jgi:LysM repeat protein